MRGALVIGVLLGILVAAQAPFAALRCGGIFERENLGLVTAAVDVLFAGTVARFTAVPFWARPCLHFTGHRVDKMRCSRPIVVDVFVTGFAGVRTNVQGWIRRPNVVLGLICPLLALIRSALLVAGRGEGGRQDGHNEYREMQGSKR